MFNALDPKSTKDFVDGVGKAIYSLINGCAILFVILILIMCATMAYVIYILCTT